MRLACLFLLGAAAACQSVPDGVLPAGAPDELASDAAGGHGGEREADQVLDEGLVLRPRRPGDFGLSLRVPVHLAWTRFDLVDGLSLDDLATMAVLPTIEMLVPLGERWTLVPFAGVGAAYQNGDADLIGDQNVVGLWTGGLRGTRWQSFAERYWFGLMGEVRYSAVMTSRDGVLGDWGTLDGALELRRDFGMDRGRPRFQGGLYLQGFHYWDPLELDIAGIDSATLDNNAEVGVSLGATEPVKLLGVTVPRVFIGAILGDLLSGVRVRFGRL